LVKISQGRVETKTVESFRKMFWSGWIPENSKMSESMEFRTLQKGHSLAYVRRESISRAGKLTVSFGKEAT